MWNGLHTLADVSFSFCTLFCKDQGQFHTRWFLVHLFSSGVNTIITPGCGPKQSDPKKKFIWSRVCWILLFFIGFYNFIQLTRVHTLYAMILSVVGLPWFCVVFKDVLCFVFCLMYSWFYFCCFLVVTFHVLFWKSGFLVHLNYFLLLPSCVIACRPYLFSPVCLPLLCVFIMSKPWSLLVHMSFSCDPQ